MHTPAKIAALSFFLLGANACAPGTSVSGTSEPGDNANGNLTKDAPTTVLAVTVDPATRAWAATEPSIHDGNPIGTSARRYREVHARLMRKLTQMGASTVYFLAAYGDDTGTPDEAPSRELGDALSAFPGKVGLNDCGGECSPSVYATGRTSNRLIGHAEGFQLSKVTTLADGSAKIEPDGYGVLANFQGLNPAAGMAYVGELAAREASVPDAKASLQRRIACLKESAVTAVKVPAGGGPLELRYADVVRFDPTDMQADLSAMRILEGGDDVAARVRGSVVFVAVDDQVVENADGKGLDTRVGQFSAQILRSIAGAPDSCE